MTNAINCPVGHFCKLIQREWLIKVVVYIFFDKKTFVWNFFRDTWAEVIQSGLLDFQQQADR